MVNKTQRRSPVKSSRGQTIRRYEHLIEILVIILIVILLAAVFLAWKVGNIRKGEVLSSPPTNYGPVNLSNAVILTESTDGTSSAGSGNVNFLLFIIGLMVAGAVLLAAIIIFLINSSKQEHWKTMALAHREDYLNAVNKNS